MLLNKNTHIFLYYTIKIKKINKFFAKGLDFVEIFMYNRGGLLFYRGFGCALARKSYLLRSYTNANTRRNLRQQTYTFVRVR